MSFPKDLCACHLARSGDREPTPETWTYAEPAVLQSLRPVFPLMGSVLIRWRPSSTTTLPFSRGYTIRSSCSRRRSTCALGCRPDPRRKITTENMTAYLSANLLGRPARRPPRRLRPAYRDPSRVGLRGRPSIAPQRRPARAHCLRGTSKGERDLRREESPSRAPLPQRNAAPRISRGLGWSRPQGSTRCPVLSAAILTTVATRILGPRMQGAPSILFGSAVIWSIATSPRLPPKR